MREIKFRAWRVEDKLMYLSPDDISHLGSWFDSHLPGALAIPEDVIIMQFTGLKDKNGAEIYEGDICEVSNNQNANHLQTVNCNYAKPLKKGDLLIIKCLLSGFTGQILSNQGEQPNLIGNVCNYSLWNGVKQLVIIGNIYQNPELL